MQKINFEKLNQLDYRTNEAYKSLRTNIKFCGDNIKVIMFTSCTSNEGKSSITFHLASSMAQDSKKVILIDSDLRKSVLIGRYKVDKSVNGLSHYLSGQATAPEVICETNVTNFHVIFTGKTPPNPSELLGHERFQILVANLRENYDYVLIDTPPLGSVIDSAVVSKVVDGAILVIENNSISYKFAQNVKEQLDKTGCYILGAVLNKVEMNKNGYCGRYYERYYGKYVSGV